MTYHSNLGMNRTFSISILALLLLASCTDYAPKPKAFSRIIYPERDYKTIETPCPYTFEIPRYSSLNLYQENPDACWYNLEYTPFDATLHLSYIPINGMADLDSLAEDAYRMVFKPHMSRAEEIIEREISDTTSGLFGMIYDLEGKTATPFNFYITDGKQHFFRGSFYFNNKTERDSILPVYDFLNKDIMHSIRTFKFK